MKTETKNVKLSKTIDQLYSNFSENEILQTDSMLTIRGGDGLDPGNGTIIMPPPPPPPLP
jgi:hypothetical protein